MPDDREGLSGLVPPALALLERSVTPSGLVCFELIEGKDRPAGESVRYSLIVLLALLRARAQGVPTTLDAGALRAAAFASINRPEVTPGDLGLALWAEAREDTGMAEDLVRQLSLALDARGGLEALEGLELAWIVIGLGLASERDTPEAHVLLRPALQELINRGGTRSGLFLHSGKGVRRRFPNFATQIYAVLALTMAREAHGQALDSARRSADVLLRLQLPDGGWPWLYDVEQGSVVERYEIYSVHQHGMAPMALLRLGEALGEPRFPDAARKGLGWLFGDNELGAELMVLGRGISRRSIRRRPPYDRLHLYGGTLATLAHVPIPDREGRALELNRTCRPYELGWLVEAWS